ncbi:MAG: rRNA maturation RNase YbeY [Beijerinckiaceae bacterium]
MPLIDVMIEDEGWSAIADVENLVIRAGEKALGHSGVAVRADAEIAVLLADDATIQKLNVQWRGQDKPTNVLSFPAVEAALIAQSPALGDIIIARETTLREARGESKTPASHLTHLVVHGVLHLLGYDHGNEEEAERMEALERQILGQLGVADPYADAPLVRSLQS